MVDNKKGFITLLTIGIFLLLSITPALAIQPTTQYSKIYLQPFYNSGMTQNVLYNYTVNINSPDGMDKISSAILTLDAWINPTRVFNAWMNNIQCNTKNYTISTTYASAGRGVVTFDCSNAIRVNQINTVSFTVSGGNIGASTSWIEIVYDNNPKGEMTIHGTEYIFGQTSKVWLQLLNNTGAYINNGICFTDIYHPNMTDLIERATMTNTGHDGLYSYDLVLPEAEGVYPVIALCYYTAGRTYNYASNIVMINGSITSGDITRTYVLDGSYLTTDETTVGQGNPRRYIAELNFTNGSVCSNIPQSLLTGITIGWTGRWNSNPSSDTMTISVYNHTSNTWIPLVNTITGVGTGVKSVTNSYAINNITTIGFVNNNGTNLRLRFEDTNVTDTATNGFDYDELYVSCDQLASPVWQEVKGSSEFHLSPRFNVSILEQAINYTSRFDSIDNAINTSRNDIMQNLTAINMTLSLQIMSMNTTMINRFNTIDLLIASINTTTTLLPENLWNYTGRYVHGTILN